jgi:hypothetical protein
METRTLFIGAEGVAEMENAAVEWCREATVEEIEAFRASQGLAPIGIHARDNRERWANLHVDKTGRPYFCMTVLNTAPGDVWIKAGQYVRVVRLTE